MGDKLVLQFNEYFARPDIQAYQRYAKVLECADEPFDSRKIDWPEMPPRTDIPDAYKNTALGKQAAKGQPAMKGTAFKYWVRCAIPADDATAFDGTHVIFAAMPERYNNVAWLIRDDKSGEVTLMGLHFI